jgi:hypothetical protein
MSFSSSKILSASGNFLSNTFIKSNVSSISSIYFYAGDIKYGNNIFVAIPSIRTGASGLLCRTINSTDGITWTRVGNLPLLGSNTQSWKLLIYGDNKYIAFNDSVRMYPEDGGAISIDSGNSWTTIYPPYLYDTVWGGYLNNVFYRLGGGVQPYSGAPTLQYSTNGTSWSAIILPTGSNSVPYSMAYGNGIYSIVCQANNTCAYSSDGINWNQSSFPVFSENVVYGNGVFVSPSRDENKIAYSSNGQNWTVVTFPNLPTGDPQAAIQLSFLNNNFIAVCKKTNWVAISNDGSSWTSGNLPIIGSWESPIYLNGLFFTYIKDSFGVTSNMFATSYDGLIWRPLIIKINTSVEFGRPVVSNSSNEIIFIAEQGNVIDDKYFYRLTLP